ncbi:MAG: hypothetical protein K2M79_02990 [Muribaculaceae bacterium]|nr:hypothetical protein [Muribaculaceae bacterium]
MKLKFKVASLALFALALFVSSCSKSELTPEEAAAAMINLVPDNADFVMAGNPEVFLNSAGVVWEDNHFSVSSENPYKSRIEKKIERLDEVGAFLDLSNVVIYGKYTSVDDVNALAYVTDAEGCKKYIKTEESLKEEDGYFGFVKDNFALVVDKKHIAHLLSASNFTSAVRSVEKAVKAAEEEKDNKAAWKSDLLKNGSEGLVALINLKSIPVDIFALTGQQNSRKFFNSDVEYLSATAKLDGATASVSIKTLDKDGNNIEYTAADYRSYSSPAAALKRLPAGLQAVCATGMVTNLANMPLPDAVPAEFHQLIRTLQQSGNALALGVNFDFNSPADAMVSVFAAMECKPGTAQEAYEALKQAMNDFGLPASAGQFDGKDAQIIPEFENLRSLALYVDGDFVMLSPVGSALAPAGSDYGINSLGGYAIDIDTFPGKSDFKGIKGVLNVTMTGADATVTLPGQEKFILGLMQMAGR